MKLDEYPLVSIIIPMYNEENYIVRCIESVLGQDYPRQRLELIIADGMSTDRSPQMVREYAQQYPFIRLIENPKKIQVAAMNLGIRQARGDYIVRMDAHSEYACDYVSKCIYYLLKTGADNAGGLYDTHPGADTPMARCIAAITSNKLVVGGSAFRTSHRPRYSDGAIFGTWRRALFDEIGYFNEALARAEDNDFNNRIMQHGGKIFQTPDIKIKYYNQAKLSGLCRQAYGNGLWNLPMLLANPTTFRFRHFATFGFDLWLVVFGLLSFWHGVFLIPLLFAVGMYALFLLVVTAQVGAEEGWSLAPLVPVAVACYHVTYGLGTAASIWRILTMGAAERGRIRAGSRIPDLQHPPRLGQNALPEEEAARLRTDAAAEPSPSAT